VRILLYGRTYSGAFRAGVVDEVVDSKSQEGGRSDTGRTCQILLEADGAITGPVLTGAAPSGGWRSLISLRAVAAARRTSQVG
jgi:hypothetical protein